MKDVFEKEVQNFQYPTTNQYFTSNLRYPSPIITLENQQAFISQIGGGIGTVYWFNSPLNIEESNFQNSPLIVPIFYNMGVFSYQFPELYYTIGEDNTIEVATNLKKDAILKLKNESDEFIPLQQIFHNKVKLKTTDEPSESGLYDITAKKSTIKTIAYNYNRHESILKYTNIDELFKDSNNITISTSVEK